MYKILRTAIVAALVCSAAWLLAFVRPRDAERIPPGRVEIQYWEKWTGREAEQMKQIVADFNRTVGADKGIWVTYMSMTAVDQKTLLATAAGVPPDVAGVFDGQIVQYAEQDALEPLEDMAREHGITEGYYKPAYWKACNYNGHMWGLVSQPAAVALLYNKRIFQERAGALRAAGLDPTRPPETIAELDRYATALDVWETDSSGRKKLVQAGYIPMEPGWYVPFTSIWFGGTAWNANTRAINLLDPSVVAAYDWIGSYSARLGQDAVGDFQAGFGNFNSPQNAFLAGKVAMVQQGPWMANYIENLNPSMNRWKMSKEEERRLPFEQRKQNYEWAAAPFPSAIPGAKDVTYITFDVLVIPRGSRHKKEAFEFIAFVNRQEEMEKLCSMQCKNSPLARVSESFIANHPNPYVDVFERLAASPNAVPTPQCPIARELEAELTAIGLDVSTGQSTARDALSAAQHHIDAVWASYEKRQRLRAANEGGSR